MLLSINVGPCPTSTKISCDIMPPFNTDANGGRWLSCSRFWLSLVPCASQSHQIPIVQWWMWLRRIVTSIAACILMPAISAPPCSIMLLIWWIWLSSMTLNTPPIRPIIPPCSQWWILLRRIICPPMFSFNQPWYCPLQTASRSIWVGLFTYL